MDDMPLERTIRAWGTINLHNTPQREFILLFSISIAYKSVGLFPYRTRVCVIPPFHSSSSTVQGIKYGEPLPLSPTDRQMRHFWSNWTESISLYGLNWCPLSSFPRSTHSPGIIIFYTERGSRTEAEKEWCRLNSINFFVRFVVLNLDAERLLQMTVVLAANYTWLYPMYWLPAVEDD